MRTGFGIAGALLIVLLGIGPLRADSTTDEIAYLLDYIRTSPCTFIRNGSDYDGPAAAEHVELKYAHFKREIKTAEDFIDRAATKSLLSGEPYQVRCDKTAPVAAASWLGNVLSAYRSQHSPAKIP